MAFKRGKIVGPRLGWWLVGMLLAGAMAAPLVMWARWPWLWAWLAGVNAVTAAFYALDKSAAGRGTRRIPEASLHGLAAVGGSPAALAARHLLRHKTIKPRFRLVFWAIVAVQAVAVGVWIWTR